MLGGLDLYLQAFFELNCDRPIGMVAGPIPWTAMAAYAKYHELDTEQSEELFYFLREMDRAYLDFTRPKDEAS